MILLNILYYQPNFMLKLIMGTDHSIIWPHRFNPRAGNFLSNSRFEPTSAQSGFSLYLPIYTILSVFVANLITVTATTRYCSIKMWCSCCLCEKLRCHLNWIQEILKRDFSEVYSVSFLYTIEN